MNLTCFMTKCDCWDSWDFVYLSKGNRLNFGIVKVFCIRPIFNLNWNISYKVFFFFLFLILYFRSLIEAYFYFLYILGIVFIVHWNFRSLIGVYFDFFFDCNRAFKLDLVLSVLRSFVVINYNFFFDCNRAFKLDLVLSVLRSFVVINFNFFNRVLNFLYLFRFNFGSCFVIYQDFFFDYNRILNLLYDFCSYLNFIIDWNKTGLYLWLYLIENSMFLFWWRVYVIVLCF